MVNGSRACGLNPTSPVGAAFAGTGIGIGQGTSEGYPIVPGLFMKHPLAMVSAPLSLAGWWEITDIAMAIYL